MKVSPRLKRTLCGGDVVMFSPRVSGLVSQARLSPERRARSWPDAAWWLRRPILRTVDPDGTRDLRRNGVPWLPSGVPWLPSAPWRVRRKDAHGAGLHGVLEQIGERRARLTDAFDGVANTALDGGASALRGTA